MREFVQEIQKVKQTENNIPDSPLTYGNAVTARGELRFHIFTAHTLNIILVILLILVFCKDRAILSEYIEKGIVVIKLDNGRATVYPSRDSRNVPTTDEEIQAVSLDVVSNILTASSDNIESNYKIAMKYMSARMRKEFEDKFLTKIPEIKKLKFTTLFDNRKVKQLDESDLAPGTKFTDDLKYHVIISGQLNTHHNETGELINSKEITYHVHLLPLNRRTVMNPSAILVDSIDLYEMPNKVKENNNNGETN